MRDSMQKTQTKMEGILSPLVCATLIQIRDYVIIDWGSSCFKALISNFSLEIRRLVELLTHQA